jgi:hypothetical protein
LVQDVLFVAEKEGVKPPLPDWAKYSPGGKPEEGREGYWWEFNVYANGSLLPANPQTSDLPCWMNMECDINLSRNDVMGDCRDWLALSNCGKNPAYPRPANCEIAKLPPSLAKIINQPAVFGLDFPAPSFIRSDNLISCNPTDVCQNLADFYISSGTANSHGNFQIATYYYPAKSFNVYYDQRTDTIFLASGSPPFYAYVPISKLVRPAGKTLQLGTFFPIKKFSYEWWTPACKPAIYLYPERPIEVSVKVSPEGYLTESIPSHGQDGWQVLAYPDGRIECDKKGYPYLYYEAQVKNVNVPKQGFVVKQENLANFFAELLPKLGLNQKEAEEFSNYWLSALTNSPFYFVGVLPKEEIDRVEKIDILPFPDIFIRVRLFFEPLAKEIKVDPPNLSSPSKREGFVAVDWGGILKSGTCGEGQLLNQKVR